MSNTLRVAVAQILSGADPDDNLELVATRTAEAAENDAQLVIFPEATMRRFGLPLAEVAEPVDGPWAQRLRKIADYHQLVVVAGMFTPGDAGRVHNTLRVVGPGVDAHYDKIHLYDAFGFTESRTVAPGHEPVVITVDGVGVGLTLCYDVRFPELYVELARRGAHVITVHASWGTGPGKLEQWTLLARARALDTGSFVAAVGQAYPGDEIAAIGPTGVGGSVVASPLGEVVDAAGAEPSLLVSDIDTDTVASVRDTIAVLRNRSDFADV